MPTPDQVVNALAEDIAAWFRDADIDDTEEERLTDAFVLIGWLGDRGWLFAVAPPNMFNTNGS